MANPTDKSPAMDRFISGVMGKDRKQTITNNKCMACEGDANIFRDRLSKKEYTISGMCQRCQDSVFGIGEEY